MALYNLTKEKMEQLKENIKQKVQKHKKVEQTTESEMWIDDLKLIDFKDF